MITVVFNRNWNGKLGCDTFTTFRPYNPLKYAPGEGYQVCLKDRIIGEFELIEARSIKFDNITDWMAYLDAGMNADEMKKTLLNIYGKKIENWHYLLFKRIK